MQVVADEGGSTYVKSGPPSAKHMQKQKSRRLRAKTAECNNIESNKDLASNTPSRGAMPANHNLHDASVSALSSGGELDA